MIYAALACTLLMSSGCAVFNRNNTPALNYVEKHLIPAENPGKALSYPLIIPLGAVAATMDMFVFHPISVVSESWDDTTELLWQKMPWDTQYATTTASLVPRAVLTPVIFTGDFLFRSTFDVNGKRRPSTPAISKEEYARRQEEKKRIEQENARLAAEALHKGNYAESITLANKALAANSYLYDMAAIKASALLESEQLDALSVIPQYHRIFSNTVFLSRFIKHLNSASPADTLRLLSILEKHNIARPPVLKNKQPTKEQQDLIEYQGRLSAAIISLFEHEDRAVKLRAIQVAGKRSNEMKELQTALGQTASNADPVMAVAAKEALAGSKK